MDPNDPLWDVLGKAPLREPDAWFAARTVARLRREKRPTLWRRFVLASAAVGLSAVAIFMAMQLSGSKVPAQNTAQIQDALNYIADRSTETDMWLATSTL